MRVVAVDDDVVVHMALAMSWDGVEVIECTRATGAFMIGVTEQPDAFVIDQRLPDGDGLALVRRLRQDLRTNQTPIVVLSAAHDPANEAQVLKSGADAYLAKPFEPAELLQVVESILALPTTERRSRRKRCVELLHDGFAPEPLIDLTDGALAAMDWREDALRHGRESDAHRRRFWRRGAPAIAGR